ncbi:MAG: HAD family hydrolase [Bacteroidales bacterium]|nr:HAD family hydrolase [Bacteroidales bacterium]
MQKAIFLDRDGVLINDAGRYYIYKTDDIIINNGVIDALKRLTNMGFLLVVISNQGGVAKQIYTKEDVEKIHSELKRQFKIEGIDIKEYYYCPHHSDVEKCLCRKPEPILIEKALARFNIDPNKSFMIGDNKRDIDAGKKVGLSCIKIKPNQNLLDVLPHINT